jgi:hypothetical protein
LDIRSHSKPACDGVDWDTFVAQKIVQIGSIVCCHGPGIPKKAIETQDDFIKVEPGISIEMIDASRTAIHDMSKTISRVGEKRTGLIPVDAGSDAPIAPEGAI